MDETETLADSNAIFCSFEKKKDRKSLITWRIHLSRNKRREQNNLWQAPRREVDEVSNVGGPCPSVHGGRERSPGPCLPVTRRRKPRVTEDTGQNAVCGRASQPHRKGPRVAGSRRVPEAPVGQATSQRRGARAAAPDGRFYVTSRASPLGCGVAGPSAGPRGRRDGQVARAEPLLCRARAERARRSVWGCRPRWGSPSRGTRDRPG